MILLAHGSFAKRLRVLREAIFDASEIQSASPPCSHQCPDTRLKIVHGQCQGCLTIEQVLHKIVFALTVMGNTICDRGAYDFPRTLA